MNVVECFLEVYKFRTIDLCRSLHCSVIYQITNVWSVIPESSLLPSHYTLSFILYSIIYNVAYDLAKHRQLGDPSPIRAFTELTFFFCYFENYISFPIAWFIHVKEGCESPPYVSGSFQHFLLCLTWSLRIYFMDTSHYWFQVCSGSGSFLL